MDLRIFRSFRAKYYEDDILYGPAAYPPEYFDELVANGFNAVWLRGILRDLARGDSLPELAGDIARHQDALATVIARAKARGVKVMLYLNEPLCLPADHPFWKAHPEVRGSRDESSMDEWPDTYALCTSTPPVRAWLRQVTQRLFQAVPDLGGWFLISASEHHTNCLSHGKGWCKTHEPCPRCEGRDPCQVVAELITDLRDGTRAASASAEMIAWNWSWTMYAPDPQPALLAGLPKDVTVLLDWERGGNRVMPGGRKNFVDEYSLAYVGPSERFLAGHHEARKHGLKVMAKLQIGTTHELATVPNMPLVGNLYDKLRKAEELGLHGVLATWNFGNAFSLNTAAVARFARTKDRPAARAFVEQLAAEYFPGADAAGVADAVEAFQQAMQHFPFSIPMLYHGPANYALMYRLTLAPLTGKPMGRTWVMDERGDEWKGCLGDFTLQEALDCLEQVWRRWNAAAEVYARALASCHHAHAARELGVAGVIGCCYRSAWNVLRTYRLRRDQPPDAKAQFAPIVRDEIENLTIALPLIEADDRLGFHAECQHYQFTAGQVRAKIDGLRGSL